MLWQVLGSLRIACALASLGRSGTLRIEEISSGTELLTQALPRDNSASLAISPNGKLNIDEGIDELSVKLSI